MKTLLVLAGFFIAASAQVLDHIEDVGCYKSTTATKPPIYKNVRQNIDWKTFKSPDGLYKTINECATGAQVEGFLFFGIEYFGECRSNANLKETIGKMTKLTADKCKAGVGGPNVIMIYKGKCESVYGCCPDGITGATGKNNEGCPVDGQWSDYGDWSACSETCGDGTQTRKRTCTNPAPQNGGADCVGDDTETQACNLKPCPPPVNGGWSEWSTFEPAQCPVTCGGGVQARTRTCDNPKPANGGQDCVGEAQEEKKCNEQTCPFVCTGKKLDIALIVDTSGSIDQFTEFPSVKKFLALFSQAFVMSTDDSQSQIASIRFGTNATITFDFNKYTNNNDLKAFLENYPYVRGWTNTPAALDLARTQLFTTAKGYRNEADVTPITIVLTDGESRINQFTTLNKETIAASKLLKAHGAPNKVHLMAVGIGDGINHEELQSMVNESDKDVFEMTDFGNLVTRVYDVAKAVCDLGM